MKVNSINSSPKSALHFASSPTSVTFDQHTGHHHGDNVAGTSFKGLLDSFLTMWLPMFAAMAIKLPGLGSLNQLVRIPVEVSAKAGLGLLLSEFLRTVFGSKLTHH